MMGKHETFNRLSSKKFIISLIIFLCMCVFFVFWGIDLFGSSDSESKNLVPPAQLVLALNCFNLSYITIINVSVTRKLAIQRLTQIKKRGKMKMAVSEMIKNLVGRTVRVCTMTAYYVGDLTETDDEWIKLVQTNRKGDKEYIIKADMITSITIK